MRKKKRNNFKLDIKNQNKIIDYMKSGDYWIFQLGLLAKVFLAMANPFFYLVLIVGAINILSYISVMESDVKLIALLAWCIVIVTMVTKIQILGRFFDDIFRDIK